ncbi:restriction endonuclease subunit S [Algoriphagus sp. A40]|uniref:restriction endonuclease subunit S n=1 Tax=Algoriphagus sp. A40 TaxID=1945863 RepID=UPI0009CA65F3|nr:restriction endonuclease subunit S [Algoriphagus sp. A40]OOG76453.1 hypothetical protein B0E43_08150 [Algoriphagus sp. A40]
MKEKLTKYSLPKGWVWTTIEQLGVVNSGGTPSTKESTYWNGNIPWISPADLSGYKEKYISKGKKSITQEGLEESSATLLPEGSILFSSRAPIGYVAISKNELATNQGFKNLIPAKSVNKDYIYYYFKSAKQLAESVASGTTFLELSGSSFSKLPVPLPPLNEQGRIATKLEELFSELDHSIENLRWAQAQLKVYRQTILKNAFEGKLTAEWRKENRSKWNECRLGQIISVSSGKGLTSSQRNDGGDYDVYGGNGKIGMHSEYLFEERKIIIGRVGVNCGNVHITTPKSWVTDNAFVTTYDDKEYDIEFLRYFLKDLNLNQYSSSTAQPVISGRKIYPIIVKVPSIEEQVVIVQELESIISMIDNLEFTIIQEIIKSELTRQSIFKKAFDGKLVSQSPDDEPAFELLKRIEEEKKKCMEEKKQQKKKAPKKPKNMSKNLSIEDVLKAAKGPLAAKKVWEESKHKNDIEEFYAELKKLGSKIEEIREGMESKLTLK